MEQFPLPGISDNYLPSAETKHSVSALKQFFGMDQVLLANTHTKLYYPHTTYYHQVKSHHPYRNGMEGRERILVTFFDCGLVFRTLKNLANQPLSPTFHIKNTHCSESISEGIPVH